MAALLVLSVLAMSVRGGTSESLVSLFSQTVWGLISDDGFLVLILSSCLLEGLRCLRIHGSKARIPGNEPDGVLDAAIGSSTIPWVERFSGAVHLSVLGYLLPIGRLALLLALVLGLRGSEALAAMTVPFVMVGGAILLTLGVTRPDSLRLSVVDWLVGLVFTLIGLVVLFGYARLVEAVALAVISVFCLGLYLHRRGRVELGDIVGRLSRQVGFVSLYAISGACLYVASELTGVREGVVSLVVGNEIGIAYAVAACLVISTVLSVYFGPLIVALCLLPVGPPAIAAAGTTLAQTFVLYCSIIAGAQVVGLSLKDDATQGTVAARLSWGLTLAVIYTITAVPQLSTFLVEQGRFW